MQFYFRLEGYLNIINKNNKEATKVIPELVKISKCKCISYTPIQLVSNINVASSDGSKSVIVKAGQKVI